MICREAAGLWNLAPVYSPYSYSHIFRCSSCNVSSYFSNSSRGSRWGCNANPRMSLSSHLYSQLTTPPQSKGILVFWTYSHSGTQLYPSGRCCQLCGWIVNVLQGTICTRLSSLTTCSGQDFIQQSARQTSLWINWVLLLVFYQTPLDYPLAHL